MARKKKSKMWFDWNPTPADQLKDLGELCPSGEYRVVSADKLPEGILSPTLEPKIHSVLMMSSGDATTGRLYMMLNYNRIDGDEIDQMPYGIAYDGDTPIVRGVLVQHGDYDDNRTTELPPDFYEFVSKSGIYPLQEMPTDQSGYVSDLKIGSQRQAFETLKSQFDVSFPPDDSDGSVPYHLV